MKGGNSYQAPLKLEMLAHGSNLLGGDKNVRHIQYKYFMPQIC